MADGRQRPEKGSPEYNWLYGAQGQQPPGDETRAMPQQPRAGGDGPDQSDATRVMPAVQRDARGQRPAPPTSPPPPSKPVSGPSANRGWRPKPKLRWIGLLLVLWLVFLVAIPLWAWSKVDQVNAFPQGGRPDDQPGTTYLMVGSDSRGDLSEDERKELGTGNASGQRTDTIMLLHTGAGPNLLMSIPRDSIVDIPGYGSNKINAAYAYQGPRLLVKTIENETGIRIDHFVEIGFGGFVDLVDAVGGIEVCPTFDMKDPLAKIDLEKGCQDVDGPDGARLRPVAQDRHAVRRPGSRRSPARGRLRDRQRGHLAVVGHQPGALLPAQHGRRPRGPGQRGHVALRPGPVGAGDDPRQR